MGGIYCSARAGIFHRMTPDSGPAPLARARAACLLLCLGLAACYRGTVNYADIPGPRFAGPSATTPAGPAPGSIRVVTWNVQWGERAGAAAELLATHPQLRDADILVVQELDEHSAATIAGRLGMGYVYYPATLHPRTRRHFGTAILSPWPLTDDRKLILPHLARFVGTARAAVVATALIGEHRVRVYGLHLATSLGVGPRGIEDQLREVRADAQGAVDPVVVAGDLNSSTAGGILAEAGYLWVTRYVGPTTRLLPLDHIFVRGLPEAPGETGVVKLDDLPSDHRPVWAVLRLAP